MNSPLLEIADALSAFADGRHSPPAPQQAEAQGASLVKRQVTEVAAFRQPDFPIEDAPDLADAIAGLRSVASSSGDLQVSRLLSEFVRHARVCGSMRTLMAFVEDRLRRHVPLLAVTFIARPRALAPPGDCLSFELGHSDDGPNRLYVGFKPACPLDDAQVRLLHAAASVMSLIHGWHRAQFRSEQ